VNRNIKLLYGFSFFDQFMIVIALWIPYLTTQGITMRQFMELQYTLGSYQQHALGYLAVVRKDDGALIGRCGLMDLVVESAPPGRGTRRGWFGREGAPAGVALTFETELGYTFDPAVWGQGFATEAARCVRDYARDVLRLPYAISAILPQNARSRRVAERSGARAAGQMEVVGLTWDRYMWPLDTGGAPEPEPGPTT
jgi:RimJ/RimL family protein N-acetyltransferase